ncbi:facilitated trehalose transporter Tret1-2 homolog isoform X2 [Oppia nitens]|nr:facilitated trehalose transporter Tret1-2 homolog isoform X2 [Oppia nitens]
MATDVQSKSARKPSVFLFIAATSALFGAIAMGTVLGWSSPAVTSLKDPGSSPQIKEKGTQTEAWIKSSTTLGALVGALASGPLAQVLGRKLALILYGIPMIAGYLCLWLAPDFATIIVGRTLTGLSAGLISGTAPTYVVEISTENVRGMLGTGFQLSVTIGILMVYVFGAFLTWSWLSFICLFLPIVMSLSMLLMPETPIWLMTKAGGDHSKGSKVEKSLKSLRDTTNDNDSELNEIAEQAEESSKTSGFSMKEINNPLFYKPFVLSVILMWLQQFSGINAVMFNSSDMLTEAGSTLEGKYAAIIIGVAQVIATLAGTLLVDRLGRKILLIGSGIGHAISLGILGIYYIAVTDRQNSSFGWIPILCLVVFIISFSLGWGPIPWLMINEITAMHFRGVVSASATGMNWFCAFLITHNFEAIQKWTSPQFTFFMFAFWCVVSVPFVIIFLPETKGKTFDEIQKFFVKSSDGHSDGHNKMEMKGLNE